MKKISLLALAVPALFAACSQEDIVSDVQGQSSELLGKVAGDVEFVFEPETRMSWSPTASSEEAIKWNPDGDAFSLFWVGNESDYEEDDENYVGVANALYKSVDGARFKSENIIYEGNHIIVYPADYAHYTQKEIVVSVPEPQSAADDLGEKRTVAVSDLLTIKAPLTGPNAAANMAKEPGTIWAGGYNESLEHKTTQVNVLSSHMVLNLNFDLKKLTEVEIRSVKLVSDKSTFATSGQLLQNEDGFISLNPETKASAITLEVANAKVNTENKSYTAQISLLPPVWANVDAKYSIVVETNYGLVTIDKALDVTNNSGKAQFKPFTDNVEGEVVAGEADEETLLSFYTEFTDIATRTLDTDSKEEGNQSEASYGKRIIRNVNVDMSKASIANWPVKTSDDLIAAYEIYDNLERGLSEETREETFVLEGEAIAWSNQIPTSSEFKLTPQAYEAIQEHPYVTLVNGSVLKQIKFIANDGEQFTSVPALTAMTQINQLDAYMVAGNTWNLNIYEGANLMAFKSFTNQGEVTLTAVQNKDKYNANITSDDLTSFKSTGTAIFNHTVTDKVNYTLSGTTTVAADKSITLAGTENTIAGTLNVNGELIVSGGKTTLTSITNVSGSLLSTTNAELINNGTIWMKQADASLIISKQGASGVIELQGRHNNVRVSDDEAQGYIKWTCDDTTTTLTKDATDAFNYVRLGSSINWVQDEAIDYIEITGNKVQITGTATSLQKVFVNNGKTLVVPNGSSISTTAVGGNTGGKVQVYGTFTHSTTEVGGTYNGVTIYDFNETTPI